jgi:hypothetical protein
VCLLSVARRRPLCRAHAARRQLPTLAGMGISSHTLTALREEEEAATPRLF